MCAYVFLVYVILMYLYIHTFYYLKKAELTGCFNPRKVNLKFMEFFQLLEIIALTMTIMFLPYFVKNKKKTGSVALIVSLVVLAINMFMALNVYNFYSELKYCSIMSTWNKWWLYTEGIMAAISSVRGLLSIALFLLVLFKIIKIKK
uniref:Uncharacterized protein n=1 Tax=viral metagenome TaxID=1070528 RepID=A0A6C0ESQ8_9ZZZZ